MGNASGQVTQTTSRGWRYGIAKKYLTDATVEQVAQGKISIDTLAHTIAREQGMELSDVKSVLHRCTWRPGKVLSDVGFGGDAPGAPTASHSLTISSAPAPARAPHKGKPAPLNVVELRREAERQDRKISELEASLPALRKRAAQAKRATREQAPTADEQEIHRRFDSRLGATIPMVKHEGSSVSFSAAGLAHAHQNRQTAPRAEYTQHEKSHRLERPATQRSADEAAFVRAFGHLDAAPAPLVERTDTTLVVDASAAAREQRARLARLERRLHG